jgi:uncharacterized phage-associated protein
MEQSEPAISAIDVAAAIITRHPGLDQMQLHKLLYLIQAAFLSWFGDKAFNERIEAWTWGPMTRGVAGHYMQYDRQLIDKPNGGDPTQLGPRLSWTVDEILRKYGDFDGPALALLTKAPGSPWVETRGDLPGDAVSDREIPTTLIQAWHRRHGVTLERFLGGDDDAFAALFTADNA